MTSIGLLVQQIDKARLESLLHRDVTIVPDGYPASSLGDRGSPGGHSTPTEGAMLARNQDVRVCLGCFHEDQRGTREERIRRHAIPVTEKTPAHAPCPSCGGETQLHIMEREVRDELRETVRSIENNIEEAERLLAGVVDSLSYIAVVDEETQGRLFSPPCAICLTLPAVTAGWCPPCHQDWADHGRPDRVRWVMWKQETKNSEGLLLVAECPPPSRSP